MRVRWKTEFDTALEAPALSDLKEKVSQLEGNPRRFSRVISVSGAIDSSLPNHGLALGCIHEIRGTSLACAIGFASLLAGRISDGRQRVLYVASDQSLYPLGLLSFGLRLDQWLHVCARRSDERAWAVLEALRCPGLTAVLAVLEARDLTVCRRLQLSAENSGVTGFLLGTTVSAPAATAVTRWRVSSLSGNPKQAFGEPVWKLELMYCRGARPGEWIVNCRNQKLETVSEPLAKPVQRVVLPTADALAG